MVTISVCMIVKTEADILARCLDSLSGLYEELIIVDTGSTDETKEIAAQYTDQIYDFVIILSKNGTAPKHRPAPSSSA